MWSNFVKKAKHISLNLVGGMEQPDRRQQPRENYAAGDGSADLSRNQSTEKLGQRYNRAGSGDGISKEHSKNTTIHSTLSKRTGSSSLQYALKQQSIPQAGIKSYRYPPASVPISDDWENINSEGMFETVNIRNPGPNSSLSSLLFDQAMASQKASSVNLERVTKSKKISRSHSFTSSANMIPLHTNKHNAHNINNYNSGDDEQYNGLYLRSIDSIQETAKTNKLLTKMAPNKDLKSYRQHSTISSTVHEKAEAENNRSVNVPVPAFDKDLGKMTGSVPTEDSVIQGDLYYDYINSSVDFKPKLGYHTVDNEPVPHKRDERHSERSKQTIPTPLTIKTQNTPHDEAFSHSLSNSNLCTQGDASESAEANYDTSRNMTLLGPNDESCLKRKKLSAASSFSSSPGQDYILSLENSVEAKNSGNNSQPSKRIGKKVFEGYTKAEVADIENDELSVADIKTDSQQLSSECAGGKPGTLGDMNQDSINISKSNIDDNNITSTEKTNSKKPAKKSKSKKNRKTKTK